MMVQITELLEFSGGRVRLIWGTLERLRAGE